MSEGTLIRMLETDRNESGFHSVPLDLSDFDPGVYLVVIQTAETIRTTKLIHVID
jgi:hypothetical protein